MKKQWISVKCGLSRDPKHRQKMGESIWLFLHILDTASWEDGTVHEWKDEAVAEEMEMPVRTLREHRRHLDELGYITCIQKQYGQDIVIHNWTNPREYSGQTYNKKQGDTELEAQQDYIQGDTQGYIQGSTKHVTPTSNSNNKESNINFKQKPDLIDMELEQSKKAQAMKEVTDFFEKTFGFGALNWDSSPTWRKFAKWLYAKKDDLGAFKEYVTWRNGKGQYKGAMTNTAIRRDPQIFMDTGWPTFLAYSSMYSESSGSTKQDQSQAAIQSWLAKKQEALHG